MDRNNLYHVSHVVEKVKFITGSIDKRFHASIASVKATITIVAPVMALILCKRQFMIIFTFKEEFMIKLYLKYKIVDIEASSIIAVIFM